MAKKSSVSTLADLISSYGAEVKTEFCSTGVDALDYLWGGGVPLGYMLALWGKPGCGKSTLACQISRSFCRQGKRVVYLDSERSLNDVQRRSFGLESYAAEGLFIHLTVQTYRDLEKQVKVISDLDGDSKVSLVVVDSVSQIEAWASKEVTLEDAQIGVKARQQGWVLPRMKSWFADAGIASILLFHARANFSQGWGAAETKQDGGFCSQHVPDIITKLGVGAAVKEKNEEGVDVPVGAVVYIECEKNKFGVTRQQRVEKLIYGLGISKRISTIDAALRAGIIVGRGASYQLPSGVKYLGLSRLYNMPQEELRGLIAYMKGGGEVEAPEGVKSTSEEIVVDEDGVIVDTTPLEE